MARIEQIWAIGIKYCKVSYFFIKLKIVYICIDGIVDILLPYDCTLFCYEFQTTVYCLVRESPDMTLLERLQEARQQFGLRKFVSTDRVIPLKGLCSTITN